MCKSESLGRCGRNVLVCEELGSEELGSDEFGKRELQSFWDMRGHQWRRGGSNEN